MELKKLIKETKHSLKTLNKHGKSEFGESKKKLKKNLKKLKKELPESYFLGYVIRKSKK